MTLLENFDYLGTNPEGKEFLNRVTAACHKVGTDTMLAITIDDPDARQYQARMLFIKESLNAQSDTIKYIAVAMVSQGLDNNTSDAALITAIESNFNQLSLLHDPTLEE